MNLTIKIEWTWSDDHGRPLIGEFHYLPTLWVTRNDQTAIAVQVNNTVQHLLYLPQPPIPAGASGSED